MKHLDSHNWYKLALSPILICYNQNKKENLLLFQQEQKNAFWFSKVKYLINSLICQRLNSMQRVHLSENASLNLVS